MTKKPLKLIVHDFVNFEIEGLTPEELSILKKRLSYPVKGAFTTAAFKAKIWDGRESFFIDNVGLLYELEKSLNILSELGYDIDDDIELFNHQGDVPDVDYIDDDYMEYASGYKYRDYQQNAINQVISNGKGILDIGTNGGKTWICAGISKVYDHALKSLVLVPSENLVNQTFRDYDKTGMSVVALTKKVKPSDRKKTVANHRHVIMTTKLFLQCYDIFTEEPWVLMVDEVHNFGPVLSDILRLDMAHCPIRVGLSASLPTDKTDPYKKAGIFGVIGGGILSTVKQHELISRGISASMKIRMVETSDPEMEELCNASEFDWSMEENYLLNNRDRASSIADYLNSFDRKNTLILCHAGLAVKIADILGLDCITDETPVDVRESYFKKFDTSDDYRLVATFGCAGTGLSINRIFREFMIDVGKNETYILQGIGRGLRLDGVENKIEIIDISAKTKYSSRHKKERVKVYQREKFEYTVEKEYIQVVSVQ